jgi:hypothetical protein
MRGMLCFSCEPAWDKYLSPTPAPGVLTLASVRGLFSFYT